MSSSPLQPNTLRVKTLSQWTEYFHPTHGTFRTSISGDSIEHLDIDLRYVDQAEPQWKPLQIHVPLNLPNVCKLTLRGGEYCQDVDDRMECLSEVLQSITPVEVRWLNAFDHPDEQQTLSTVMVHPAIIAAGVLWAQQGTLAKLTIQGGFPTPNLTAPTPFSLTPATTPLPSPGHKTSFDKPFSLSTLPSLSTTKPKKIDEAKLKEREERRRLADYNLKPRWEFAFGSWGVQEIRWNFDGRYTPAGILAVMKYLVQALDETFPSAARRDEVDLPSLFAFSPLPVSILEQIKDLATDLNPKLVEYLADASLFSTNGKEFFSLWPQDGSEKRAAQRLKAEMLLLRDSDCEIIETVPTKEASPAGSNSTLDSAESDDETEAVTPMDQSILVEPKPSKVGNLAQTLEETLI